MRYTEPHYPEIARSRGVPSVLVTSTTLAGFLNPEGFDRPRVSAVLREASVVGETGRYALRSLGDRRARRGAPYAGRTTDRGGRAGGAGAGVHGR